MLLSSQSDIVSFDAQLLFIVDFSLYIASKGELATYKDSQNNVVHTEQYSTHNMVSTCIQRDTVEAHPEIW